MTTQASAHVKSGRLCIVGLHDSPLGPIPFAYHVAVEGVEDGPVDVGNDSLVEPVAKAIDESRKPIMANLQREEIKLAAESLVTRAREGDQNAMASIVAIREAAKRGVKRAQFSFKQLGQYIKSHPISEGSKGNRDSTALVVRKMKEIVSAGGDVEMQCSAISTLTSGAADVYVAATIIADALPLTTDVVEDICSRFDEEDQPIFAFAFTHYQDTRRMLDLIAQCDADQKRIAFTGHAVGLGQTIQGVRLGKFPVSRLCKIAGWELGE